jgi:cytochrome c556
MSRFVIAAAFLGLSALSPVLAQETPSMALIAGRQAGMDLQSAVLGDIKRAVEAKADVKVFKPNADAIVAFGKAIPGFYMVGTETGHDTKALPAIWSDRAGFEKLAANLVAAGEKMSLAAAAEDKAAFAEAFSAAGQTCGACHRGFRAR